MLKTLSVLFAFLMLVSCGKSGGGNSGSKGDAVTMQEIESGVVPQAALNFNMNLKMDGSFNGSEADKIHVAGELIKKVFASEEFKDAILNFSYNGKKQFVDNGGLSNAQIYKKIIEGSEALSPGIDNEMDLSMSVYKANNIVVGYTTPGELGINMNSKFLDMNPGYKVTTNMVHEWLHKLGFVHAYNSTPSRPYSVPYAVGYLVARLAVKYL
ncbi:MAG: hypothetical protein ACJ76H_10395 [Bacteriovoracaceae bacterium]